MKVKICGITSVNDSKLVSACPLFAIGLNFIPRSKRKINLETAKNIIKSLNKTIKPILIFENEEIENVLQICKKLKVNFIQLHGGEIPTYCRKLKLKNKKIKIIKAFSGEESTIKKINKYKNVCDYVLIDSKDKKNKMGGTGKKVNLDIAKKIVKKAQALKLKVFLAGGLNPENIKGAIKKVKPDFIDVNSGVESDVGKKDRGKIEKLFISLNRL